MVGVLPIRIVQSNVLSIGPSVSLYEGSMLEMLDHTIRIGSTQTILCFDLYLYSAYAAHYVYIYIYIRYTMYLYVFSKNVLVYYCKCCNLIGYATRYLFNNQFPKSRWLSLNIYRARSREVHITIVTETEVTN